MDLELFIPFNSVNGDRKHNADGLAEMIRTVLTTGVSPQPDAGFFVSAAGGWNLSAAPGRCVIDGRIGANEMPVTFTVPPPNGTLDQIFRVVIRCDYVNRNITIYLKAGTASATAMPPSLQNNTDAKEISVAQIFIARNAAGITQSVITDERPNQAVCGFVTAIPPLDTESVFAQYTAKFDELYAQMEDLLNEDVAGLLYGMIQDIIDDGAVNTFTHQRTAAKVHNFTGDGRVGKAKITAAFQAGDTFAVNGVACTAAFGADPVKSLPVGHWIEFVNDGALLDFRGGDAPQIIPQILYQSATPGAGAYVGQLWLKPV